MISSPPSLCNDKVGQMLKKLSLLWQTRAAVNQGVIQYDESLFDASRKDFSETLLPFRHHEAWLQAPEQLRSTCLSYAWGLYNLKTIYIECDIVTPSCEDIIKSPPDSDNREILQDVMSEALLDEALHTRMSVMASNYIYSSRMLQPLRFRDFHLIKWKSDLIDRCDAEWKRRLTRFSIACASETLITDYLMTMSEDDSIQKICHEVTKTHAEDEWSHSSVFSFVAMDIVKGLSVNEKKYVASLIRETVHTFADNELPAWETIFSMVKFPHYKEIIGDTHHKNEITVYSESAEQVIDRIGLGI